MPICPDFARPGDEADSIMDTDTRYREDRELARRVLAGSEPDWHAFVDKYTPLILSVLRRYIFDDDQVKDVWADMLERLYRGQLERYEGRSLLGTWLVFVARSAAIDHLRHVKGRPRPPRGWDDLPERERFVYQELFVYRHSPEEVGLALHQRGELAAGESLAGIVAGLEDRLGDNRLQRLAWDLHADSVGAVSGRLLEYLEHAAAESSERQRELSPDRSLHHRQTRETLDKIRRVMEELPPDEQRVIELKFGRGLTAPQIAQDMSLRQREVYTLVERALRNFRKLLGVNILLLISTLGGFFP